MRSRASPALLPADRLELALGASLCQRQEAVVTMDSGNISRFTQNRQQLLSFPGPELPNAWILRHDGEGLGRTHCGQTALWVWSSTVHVPSSLAHCTQWPTPPWLPYCSEDHGRAFYCNSFARHTSDHLANSPPPPHSSTTVAVPAVKSTVGLRKAA